MTWFPIVMAMTTFALGWICGSLKGRMAERDRANAYDSETRRRRTARD